MSRCCEPGRYGRFFNERFARRIARKYRKRGLDGLSRRMADAVLARGVRDASLLEIGGGVGELQIELLKAGAARALNLELSAEYEAEALRLAEENGVEEQVERRIHDVAVDPGIVEPADIVILNRVVCCYPDYERLLGAVATVAGRLVVFSYPRRNVVSRLFVTVGNALLALRRNDFRAFTHPPRAMLAVLERRGLRPVYEHHGVVWQIAALERA